MSEASPSATTTTIPVFIPAATCKVPHGPCFLSLVITPRVAVSDSWNLCYVPISYLPRRANFGIISLYSRRWALPTHQDGWFPQHPAIWGLRYQTAKNNEKCPLHRGSIHKSTFNCPGDFDHCHLTFLGWKGLLSKMMGFALSSLRCLDNTQNSDSLKKDRLERIYF